METLLVFHEVDDVDRWLASPKREEFFGPLGMTARIRFATPQGSNPVELLVRSPVWLPGKRRYRLKRRQKQ